MKLARADTPDGVVEGEYVDGVLETDDQSYDLGEEATLLAPCDPDVLFCVGRNFGEKVAQMDYDVPDIPDWFIKPPHSLHPPEQPIPYPEWTEELTYAGELAVVIDEQCHEVDESDVDDVIRGYTILNDMDALDQERRTARKAFDHSGPLGPYIVTDYEPVGKEMETHINGERRQHDNTENMFNKPREVVAFMSERYTLRPGDVISFGSPANPGLVEPGDEIEIHYEGLGTLRNTIE
ncbi:MAG: fumarylacetoacetate hydrolase family protein [Halorientalis sp.]